MNEHVKRQFDSAAAGYDAQRRGLIPCFDDFYGTAVSWVETGKHTPRLLDLGTGTGLLAALVKQKYPEAQFTLIDLSENMIESARARFGDDPRVDYVVADYTAFEYTGPYDAIVSSLSIHHLPHPAKRQLFRTVHELLAPGGTFVNADQAAGTSSYFDDQYRKRWERDIRNSGLPGEAIEASIARRELDVNASVADQLAWLREAGFPAADCVYKYRDFAVFVARKAD